MKLISAAFIAPALLGLSAHAGETEGLSPSDLAVVAGTDWTGSLTYMNYQPPFEDVTIPANLEVEATDTGLKLAYIYPDEPHANSTVTLKVSGNGQWMMGAPIVSNTLSESGLREVKTAYSCEDMGKKASCEMIYSFGASELNVTKMVTYEGETEAFRRNAYSFTR